MARYKHLTVKIPPMPGEIIKTGKTMRIDLTEEQEEWMKTYFPTTPNCILLEKSGLSHSCLHRHARKLSLTKLDEIRTELFRWTYIHKSKPKCIKEGVYERFRQNARPEHLIEWRKEAAARGWSPIKSVREKDPKRYAAIMKKWGKARKELGRKEALRQKYGLKRKTSIHLPNSPFTRKQTCCRYCMKQRGYILGDMREEMGERFVMFYDANTDRSAIVEAHAAEKGFQIRQLTD